MATFTHSLFDWANASEDTITLTAEASDMFPATTQLPKEFVVRSRRGIDISFQYRGTRKDAEGDVQFWNYSSRTKVKGVDGKLYSVLATIFND